MTEQNKTPSDLAKRGVKTARKDEYTLNSDNFESTIINFYANLLTRQKPLGKDFGKVLYDNLWDLYVS